MTTLREAATQALEALEDFGMKHYENTGEVLHRDVYESLKAALVEDAMQKFTDVNQELEAALAEPVQEQPVCDECGKHKRDGWALYCVKCVEPMFTPPQRPAESVQEPQCNPHPKAPHGFLRNASHNENRYVCECEGWEPYEAGYQAGMEAALRAQS